MPVETDLPLRSASGPYVWVRALRVHQWAKNLLLLLPALAAHRAPTPLLVGSLVVALLSFSLLASAVYLAQLWLCRKGARSVSTLRLIDGTSATLVAVRSALMVFATIPGEVRRLSRLLLCCLAKKRESRPASATAFLAALDACVDVPAWTNEEARAWWSTQGARIVTLVRGKATGVRGRDDRSLFAASGAATPSFVRRAEEPL